MKLWLKYLITFIVGALMVIAVFSIKELWVQTDKAEIIKILCDGFTIAGILLLGFAGLCFCSSKGAFYGISYLFHIFFRNHNWSSHKFSEKRLTYAEYVEEKQGKAGSTPLYILVVGLVYFLIAIVFLIAFNKL